MIANVPAVFALLLKLPSSVAICWVAVGVNVVPVAMLVAPEAEKAVVVKLGVVPFQTNPVRLLEPGVCEGFTPSDMVLVPVPALIVQGK